MGDWPCHPWRVFLNRVGEAAPPRPVFRHPAQVVVTAFFSAVVVGSLLLLLPVSRAGDGKRTVGDCGLHGDERGVRHRADHGRHGDLLESHRPGGHPGPHPGRRLRDHDPGLTDRALPRPTDGAADAAHRRCGDQEHRPGGRATGAARRLPGHRGHGDLGGGGPDPALPVRLRRDVGHRRVARGLPRRVSLQQRRVRPVQRQPHGVPHRRVGSCSRSRSRWSSAGWASR